MDDLRIFLLESSREDGIPMIIGRPCACDVFKLFTLLSHLHKALVVVSNLLCTLLREVAALALNYNVRHSISVASLFPNGHLGTHHAFITILNECLRFILRYARCSGRLE